MIVNKNKKNISFYFLFFTLLFSSKIIAQDFRWARQIKGITYDYNDFANEMELDNDGNTYVFGKTESGLFDIDPTVSGVEIIDNSNIQNFAGLYLIKLDKNGNYLWGKTFGNYKRGGDNTYGMKIGSDGNVYLCATLQEFNASQNIIDSYISIIKLKPNGDIISTKKIPQTYLNGGNINPYSFDLDSQNNIFITGYFLGSITLDPSNPAMNLTTTGIDNFVIKINNTGSFAWIKAFSNKPGNIDNSKIIIGRDGNINLLNGESLYKINALNNSIIWEKSFPRQGNDTFYISNDNIILANYKLDYNDTVDVDPSSVTVNVSTDRFIIFLNLDGEYVDVKKFIKPENGNIMFSSIGHDDDGNFIFVGRFKDTVDFDPSATPYNLTSISDYGEGFYLKLDANRNFVNAFKIGHEQPQLSPYNNCYLFEIKKIRTLGYDSYLIGDFMWTCDFDPSITKQYTLKTINSSTINRDGFVLKLGPCESSKPNGESDQFFCSLNSTIADLTPNTKDIKWYSTLNSTTPLLKTTQLVDGKIYYATQQNDNCPESIERLAVIAHVNQMPNSPIITNSNFCQKENLRLSDVFVSGQNIKWYDTSFSAASLPNATLLENNRTYYASQTIGCESDRTPFTVQLYNTALPIAKTEQSFCIDQNAKITDINIAGTAILWYDSATIGNILPETTLLENGIYYATQTLNTCESQRLAVRVKIQDTQNPIASTLQFFCAQENASISKIDILGENIKWFESTSSAINLSESTPLENRITYYASQTVNNCESDRVPVTIEILEANTVECINYMKELPFPKFFTPNNDGYNDYWTIDFAYLAPNTGIRIFDRYGKFIKELNNNGVWDGNYLGQQQPASDYWFIVTRLNGTEYRGHFSLKR